MLYIGIDVHKRTLQICAIDGTGVRILECRLANDKEALAGFFGQFEVPVSVALESTHNWGMIYDLLQRMGVDVHICDPREARLIGLSKVKTDRNDAQRLATLLKGGLLPEAYVPEKDCRLLRELVRSRASMRRMATRVKNQIHATLAANWIKHCYSDLFGKAGREFLRSLELEPTQKKILISRLVLLDSMESQIAVLEEEIRSKAHIDKRAMLLTTIPGVAEFTALVVLSEIGDIRRFYSSGSLVNYAGLHPREDSSGDKVRRGSITKEGSRWLRWILVEAAQHVIRQDGKIRDQYLRLLGRKGHNRAIVAAARELLVGIYFMLSRMEAYRPDGGTRQRFPSSAAG